MSGNLFNFKKLKDVTGKKNGRLNLYTSLYHEKNCGRDCRRGTGWVRCGGMPSFSSFLGILCRCVEEVFKSIHSLSSPSLPMKEHLQTNDASYWCGFLSLRICQLQKVDAVIHD